MKKIYFLAASLLLGVASNAQTIDDNFESYPLGTYYGGHWKNWSYAPGAESIIVTDAHAVSGTKSGAIIEDGQDVILDINPIFSGEHTIQWKMLIPADRSAWIGFMEDADALGDDSMPLKLYFNTNTLISGTDFDNKMYIGMYAGENTIDIAGPIEFPIGEWATYTISLNLDDAVYSLKINDNVIVTDATYAAPGLQFGGADMWKFDTGRIFVTGATSTNDPCEWYIDDLKIVEGEISATVDLNNASIAVYPTVVKDSFTVTAKSTISEVTVFNTAGQQVLKVNPQGTTAQINTTALAAGVYVVKTVAGKEVKTTKVVVK